MGRYSRPLSVFMADASGVAPGMTALDVGCGPGALTEELVRRLGVANVWAVDPSPTFVKACRERLPGVDVRDGQAESLPFPDASRDVVLAQLVFHFVSDAPLVAQEMRRVATSGGTVAACVWDFAKGMEMLRLFWDAALSIDPSAPDEARTLRFGGEGELDALFSVAGFADVNETDLAVTVSYADVGELWSGFLAGIGPAGAYCMSLSQEMRDRVRDQLVQRLGNPRGAITLAATARCAMGRVP